MPPRPPACPAPVEWVRLSDFDAGPYEGLYGDAITMSIDTLLDEPHVDERQAIRTFGRFQIPIGTRMNGSAKRGGRPPPPSPDPFRG